MIRHDTHTARSARYPDARAPNPRRHQKDIAKAMKHVFASLIVLTMLITPALPDTIQLVQSGGVYMVPVRINDAITIPFVLDSGAADISVPEDVFKTLIRTGTVMESDFLAPATYVNADGVTRSRQRFILHQLRVGDQVIKDVVASVASDKADPLLGQNFLKKLPTWTMDNTRHTLVLGSDTPPQTAAVNGQSPQPQRGPPVATISPPATPEPRLTVAEIMKRANAARY